MDLCREGKQLCQVIEAPCDGMNAEQYLRHQLKFTKAQIKSIKFREHGLQVNGERVRVNRILRTGDILVIQVEEPGKASDHLAGDPGPIEILYEDEDLIALWKEPGLVVHPAHGHYRDTLSNRLSAYFAEKQERVVIRSIGRLDKDTNGIVVFAKNQVSAARLWKQKEEGIFWKEYLALCEGAFLQDKTGMWQIIDTPIDHAPGELMRMSVSESGLSALTAYRVLPREKYCWKELKSYCSFDNSGNAKCSLVQVRLKTGRTHQIRVHMASLGHPLVGDPLYGNGQDGKTRALLCAWRAELLQPFTGEKIRLGKKNIDIDGSAQYDS